jgi:hypothetical protein
VVHFRRKQVVHFGRKALVHSGRKQVVHLRPVIDSFIILDADDAQAWERLGHLWLFLAEAVAGRDVHTSDKGLLAAHRIEGVELYPKQD